LRREDRLKKRLDSCQVSNNCGKPLNSAPIRPSTIFERFQRPTMRILIIDNFDSFTYNLHHYLSDIVQGSVDVLRNNAITLEQIADYDGVVLSPGPGLPQDAGITLDVIHHWGNQKRILGVCLGHQAIGVAYNSPLHNLSTVFHGLSEPMHLTSTDYLLDGISSPCQVGRYHSWVIQRETLSSELEILAEDNAGEIMAIRHKTLDIRGVQFHPESIMTAEGYRMLKNWVNGK
jgi:anthranilate synthase component 2